MFGLTCNLETFDVTDEIDLLLPKEQLFNVLNQIKFKNLKKINLNDGVLCNSDISSMIEMINSIKRINDNI